MSGARGALAFLTPLGGSSTPTSAALGWFPVVGTLIGAALGGVWLAADHLWPPLVAAALVVIADLALTGLLHFDGLADSADGLLPHLSRERRLEVMSAPDVGGFAVAVTGAVLLARWAGLSSMSSSPLLLAGLWCLSRSAMAIVVGWVPYARPAGLATAFLGRSRVALVGVVAAAALLVVWRPVAGIVVLVAASSAVVAVVALARRRLGGFTGDVLGAAGVLAETTGLVVAAARW